MDQNQKRVGQTASKMVIFLIFTYPRPKPKQARSLFSLEKSDSMVRNKSKKFLYEGVILFVVEMVQKLPKSLNFAKKSTYFGQKPGRR